MARSSDLTYLSRAVFASWTFIWFLQHVWNIDRFEALRWERIKKHDLKSVITVLLVIMCPTLIFYDVSTSIIKYQEGFIVNPLNGEIIMKPNEFWSEKNKELVVPINYVICINFSIQTCLLFLLQAFWNYLAKNLTKTTFMGSLEFKSYIVYAVFSVFIFPFLQYLFRDNSLNTEIVPQLADSILMFLIALFGVRSHKRFTNLLTLTRNSSASQINIISKLEYFRDMNRYLTWSLFIGSISLLTICVDGLTTEKFINYHKFYADLLTCHISFSFWVVFVILSLIFYPSSNTVSDSMVLAKNVSFSGNMKRSLKNDPLDPPTPQWLADQSEWSSQVSSQQTNSQTDNNSYTVSVEIYEELPPPPIIPYNEGRKSNSLDIPHTPPSPYSPNPLISTTLQPLSSTTSNLPSSTNPSTNPSTKKATIQPLNLSQSLASIKQSKLEKLKYPSSPLSRNNSFDNNGGANSSNNSLINNDKNNQSSSSLVDSTPSIYPQTSVANVPIISPSPRKNFGGSLLDSSVKPPPPPKSSRRPSIISDDNNDNDNDSISSSAIRVTTSTTSLRSVYSIPLPSSDEEDKGLSTINKITNLDTRKVAPFMYQNEGPVQQERPIFPILSNVTTTKTEEKPEPKKQQQPLNIPQQQHSSPNVIKTTISITSINNNNNNNSNSNNKSKNNSNNTSSPPALTSKASPKSKSSPTTSNISGTPLTTKTRITIRPYQNSPLGQGSKSDSGTNEITTSPSSSVAKKSSPAQINNLKNSTVNRNVNVNSSNGGAVSVVKKNNVTRSRSNSTASVGGSRKVSSASTTNNEKNSVRSRVNSISNNVRNSVLGNRTRSNSTASVGNNASIRNNTKRKDRSTSISSISSTSSTSSASSSSSSSSSSSGSVKKVIKTGVGKVRRNSRVS